MCINIISYTRNNKNFTPNGFTTIEAIVSIAIFVLAIMIVNSMYTISQKSYNTGSNQSELSQNLRVSLDRISREIRQSVETITELPPTKTEPSVNEIFFQDGHDINIITYIYYYLDTTDLIRQHRAYYFTNEPDTYVPISSVDEFGDPPEVAILEDRVIGEHFNNIEFWGEEGLVHIEAELEKDNKILSINTSVYSRNK